MIARSPTNPPVERGLLLAPRDTSRAAAQGLRRSRFVHILRWVFPTFVLGVLGLLVAWPWVRDVGGRAAMRVMPNLVVENLDLTGLSLKGEPYSIRAERALQTSQGPHVIDLEKPRGDVLQADGTWLAGRALKGRYDSTRKDLRLSGQVEFFRDDGTRLTTSEMHVNLATRAVRSDSPVRVDGPFGVLQGQGLWVLDGGNVVVFPGPARAHLKTDEGHAEAPLGTDAPSHNTGKKGLSPRRP